MTDKNLTHITVVIDRSGSMAGLQQSTITGFNKFLGEQQELPGRATLTVVQFDHEYAVVAHGDVKTIAPLTLETYQPRGRTALLDAQGRSITELGVALKAMPDAERPGRVLFVTITDGMENASEAFTAAEIRALIEQQREKYGWEFIYLGANQDAVATATVMGYATGRSATYTASRTGVGQTYSLASAQAKRFRGGQSLEAMPAKLDDDKEPA